MIYQYPPNGKNENHEKIQKYVIKQHAKSIIPKIRPTIAIPLFSSLFRPRPPITIAIIPKIIPPQNKPIIPTTIAIVPYVFPLPEE